ncbi:FxsA family protein [Longispora urticae]
MRTLWLVIAALIIVPVVEIAALVAVGQVIGLGWTLLLVLATSALGGWLLRREGGRAWRAVQTDVQEGRAPGRHATDGFLVFVGGVLMLVPGFVSDLFGMLMIAPPTRGLFRGLVERVATRRLDPRLTNDLFGPRTVKIRTQRGTSPDAPIEGEIV